MFENPPLTNRHVQLSVRKPLLGIFLFVFKNIYQKRDHTKNYLLQVKVLIPSNDLNHSKLTRPIEIPTKLLDKTLCFTDIPYLL